MFLLLQWARLGDSGTLSAGISVQKVPLVSLDHKEFSISTNSESISDISKTQMFLMLLRKQMWLKPTSGIEKNIATTKKDN